MTNKSRNHYEPLPLNTSVTLFLIMRTVMMGLTQ